MKDAILNRFDTFWTQWYEALEDLTAQLHATMVEENRKLAESEDANVLGKALSAKQKKIEETKEEHEPAGEGGPPGKYDNRSITRAISDAVTNGYSDEFTQIGSNNKNAPGATGRASLQKSRWELYRDKFCDKDANNGAAGCTGDTPQKNMHVLPAKAIFAQETIDMTKEDTRDAIKELIFNVTGFDTVDPMQVKGLDSAQGAEQRQVNREYLAQADAVGALVYSLVAERAPGPEDPYIQELRKSLGKMDASPTPSKREARQAYVELLRTPKYYLDLIAKPAEVAQKELYLKAYNVMLMYDMLARQEKISMVYAVEGANMLDKAESASRGSASQYAPLRGGEKKKP